MDKNTDVRSNFQTYMIVWDINLQTEPFETIFLISPDIRLSKIESLSDKIKITILFYKTMPSGMGRMYYSDGVLHQGSTAYVEFRSEGDRSLENFKCTIFLLDLSRKTIKRKFFGLGLHNLDYNGEWTKKCCYVFAFKFKCSPSNAKQAIWMRGSTETIPSIDINERLQTELSIITVKNNAKSSSILKFINKNNNPCKMILQGSDFNFLEHDAAEQHFYQNRYKFGDKNVLSKIQCLLDVKPFEEIMNQSDITELSNIMKLPQTTVAKNKDLPSTQTNPIANLKLSPYLHTYFIDKKLCDITVHVQDQLIRAHKVALANGSKVWRDLFFANETLTSVQIVDFDYGTIKNLIEFIYTGIANREIATDQLLMATEKYRVSGLKKHCETFLSETIAMKTSANLLVLAHKYNATILFSNVVTYIGKNRSEFQKLAEAKSIFMTYPELAFELFASI